MEIEEAETAGICRAEYGKEGNYLEKQFLKPTLVFAWILNCMCFVGLLKARQRTVSGTVPRAHVGQDAFGGLPAGLENLAEGPAFVLALGQ